MDSNWLPQQANNDDVERMIKARKNEQREQERKQEQYKQGNYSV